MRRARILVVDDEVGMLEVCSETLAHLPDATIETEKDSRRAERKLLEGEFDLLVTDIRMPGLDGIGLLRSARRTHPGTAVLLITAYPSLETAVDALRLGASDYIVKPFVPADLLAAVRRLLETKVLKEENALLRRQADREYGSEEIFGECLAMRRVMEAIDKVASTDVDVLIVGEPGTGKELVARTIHARSARAAARFVPADCGAIPEGQIEAEFFGRGAGGDAASPSWTLGLLEFAEGGTFFLDEVSQVPIPLQARLLRALSERSIRRADGRQERGVDVRILCATARDLEAEVRARRFREDLYYRVASARIELPPLRERGEDLPLLVGRFTERYAREMGKGPVRVEPEAMSLLARYAWPGNVRELQSVLRRAIAMGTGGAVAIDDLPEGIVAQSSEGSPDEEGGFFRFRRQRVDAFERDYLATLLRTCQGDVTRATREAGVPRGTFYRLLKKHSLLPEEFRV